MFKREVKKEIKVEPVALPENENIGGLQAVPCAKCGRMLVAGVDSHEVLPDGRRIHRPYCR